MSLLAAASAQAAPECHVNGGPLKSLPLDRLHRSGEQRLHWVENCRSDCKSIGTPEQKPLLALDMPPAIPLLLVTRAEDVAAWHIEIYRNLSAGRAQAEALICSRSHSMTPRL
jgi:hypothetical protein